MTEKIEVRYRDISGLASTGGSSSGSGSSGSGSAGSEAYYHKYIVYTDSEGNQFAARGGPDGIGVGFGEIETRTGVFNSSFIDHPENERRNEPDAVDPSETIKEGEDLSSDWAAIKQAMDDIESEGQDYSPTGKNSNATVDATLKRADLPQPEQDDAGEYWSPGSGTDLPEGQAPEDDEIFPIKLPDWMFAAAAYQSGSGGYNVSWGGGGGWYGVGFSCPLVLDLDGDGVETSRLGWGAAGSKTYFDLDNDGFAERAAWIAGGDGLLARDRNGNGKIDDRSELFGNGGGFADGFAALRALDSNADNAITAADTNFSTLRVWIDADADGVTDAGELRTLGSLGITRIDLNATALSGVSNNENDVSARSTFTMNGVTRTVEDVWFRMDQTDTRWTGDVTLDVRTLFLPTLKGFGELKDLHVAMSLDPALLTLVQTFATGWSSARFAQYDQVVADVRAILYKWAGVESVPVVDPHLGGYNIDGRDVALIEKITGLSNAPLSWAVPGSPLGALPFLIATQINSVVTHLTAALIHQSGGADLFTGGHYDLSTGAIIPGTLNASEIANLIAHAPSPSSPGNVWQTYWNGITTFLVASKALEDFTPTELNAFNGWSPSNQSWQIYAQTVDGGLNYGINHNGTDLSEHLIGTSKIDYLYGGRGDDFLEGKGGNDTLSDREGSDILKGGDGEDRMTDDGGTDDVFTGGREDDILRDSGGNDLYFYNAGDGHDSLSDYNSVLGQTDIIRFGEGIVRPSITLERMDNWGSLRILIDGAPSIDLSGFFSGSGAYNDSRIERLEFSDGSVMSLDPYQNVLGTSGDDTLAGLDRSLLKADDLYAYDGNDTINAGAGNDRVDGGNGNDTVNGGSGDDELSGGTGNDTVNGGAGNDRLFGGLGDDTYVYSSGGGLDTIRDGSSRTETDIIRFGSGFTAAGVQLVRVGDRDLAIEAGGERRILIETQFYFGDSIRALRFDDGTSIDLTTVSYRTNGTNEADSLLGTDRAAGPDKLYGYGGDDTIHAMAGDDFLIGGTGDDRLYGGYGDDRYVYESGVDTVMDDGGNDRIDLGAGITAANLSWARAGDRGLNLLIDGTLAVRMDGQFWHSESGIERVRFADGTSFYLSSLQFTTNGTSGNDTLQGISYGANPNDTLNGLGGNDTIYGGLGHDTIDGGAGADQLFGDAGDDTYRVQAGQGADDITDYEGTDKIVFGAGFAASALTMTRTGMDLVLAFGGTTAATIRSHFYYNAPRALERLEFNDGAAVNILGTTFTQTGTASADSLYGYAGKDRLIGNDGNDYLLGYGGDDRLEGGAGVDFLSGGAGNDTYVFGAGAGMDTINEVAGEGTDTILVGFTQSQIRSWTTQSSLYIQSIANPADELRINGGYSYTDGTNIGGYVETITFSDGTSWTPGTGLVVNDTDDAHTLYGSAQADTLKGNGGNDTLLGFGGDDTMYGGNGFDTLYGNAGDDRLYGENDTDTLNGEAGKDWMRGGAGADTLRGGDGDDSLIGDAGVDALYGDAGADKFIFYTASAFSEIDTIHGFSTAEGDKLDVRDLLIGFDPLTKLITDFVQITDSAGSSVVKVDRDGTDSAHSMAQIATLQSVTGMSDEAALFNSGTLVAV
jgi:Ca2+-binding RTX toxin-like protein